MAEPSVCRRAVVAAVLVAALLAVFWPVLTFDFVGYDDESYVTLNRHVQAGLTSEGFVWAWTSFHAANWHPLTWLSHMLDHQVWGAWAAGHHLSSLLLHAANTVLLFLLLARATGAAGKSIVVAALFAIHPLHVESVAWVAERKDVLSTLLWLLTIGAWLRYTRAPGIARYLFVVVGMALGLTAKPMLVTLPFTLLLLDYWPLDRFAADRRSGRRLLELVVEKTPLLLLSVVSSVVTLTAQREALATFQTHPLFVRLGNAVVAYAAYLWKTLWPAGLAVHYPHPRESLAGWQVATALLVLTAISVAALRLRRRAPYLLTGWLWYLGTLVPVIGLVQVGKQAMADRYTYVPLIGIFVIVVWGVPDLLESIRLPVGWTARGRRRLVAVAAVLALVLLGAAAHRQVGYWRSAAALFERAAAVTRDNSVAFNALGLLMAREGRMEEAIERYGRALAVNPDFPEALNNLGGAHAAMGDTDRAIEYYRRALQQRPEYAEALNNLGTALGGQGSPEAAAEQFRGAIAARPDYAKAHANLAAALHFLGDHEGAWREVELARRLGHDPPERLVQRIRDQLDR